MSTPDVTVFGATFGVVLLVCTTAVPPGGACVFVSGALRMVPLHTSNISTEMCRTPCQAAAVTMMARVVNVVSSHWIKRFVSGSKVTLMNIYMCNQSTRRLLEDC